MRRGLRLLNSTKESTVPKSSWSVIPTTTESVYTISEMEKDINFGAHSAAASKLFRCQASYIHPREFNYSLPDQGIPEYAFVGRSNVGKSSLIEKLLGGRNLVVTSKEPGCTKSVNYYSLHTSSGTKLAYIIDLPGYGFAKISKEERDRWDKMIKDFLSARNNTVLRRAYVLIDSRRGPNEDDCNMIQLLSRAAITHQVILTKADLIAQVEIAGVIQDTFNEIMKPKRHGCLPIVHMISSQTGYGMLPLMQSIADVNSIEYGTGTPPPQSMTQEEYEENMKNPSKLQSTTQSSTKPASHSPSPAYPQSIPSYFQTDNRSHEQKVKPQTKNSHSTSKTKIKSQQKGGKAFSSSQRFRSSNKSSER